MFVGAVARGDLNVVWGVGAVVVVKFGVVVGWHVVMGVGVCVHVGVVVVAGVNLVLVSCVWGV